MAIEWIEVTRFNNKPIGAVGFIDGKAAIVTAYFKDYDGNKDGKVSWGEWAVGKAFPISLKGSAVTEVAMAGRVQMDILMKDESFPRMAVNLFTSFARGMVIDGIYAAYFARGVTMSATGVSKIVVSGTIKEFAVRKGMESAVHKAFNASMSR